MSGAKEAGIKITLDNKTFIAQITSTENAVKASGSRMGKDLDAAFKSGMKGGEGAVRGLLSTIKSGVSTFAGFGSMLGTIALIKEAQHAEGAFKKVAFQIRAGTGELVPFRGMLENAQATSLKWGKNIDDLGKAMSDIYSETGDKDFAGKSLETIAVTARASKEPIEMLSTLSGALNEKFGVTSDELGDVLANILSLGNKGGITIDELAGRIGFIGSVAREAGLSGKAGFTQMVSLLNVADDGGKNLKKNLGAIGGVLEDLGVQKNRVKIMAKLGIDASAIKGKDVTGMIGEVLKKTGGSKDKLAIAFEGEKLAFLVDIGKKYSSAFAEQTGSVKEKTAAGLAAYEEALAKAGKSHLDYTQVHEIATKSMQSGPAKLDAAMERMKAAFTRPEITESIGKLADALPKLAQAVSNGIDYMVKNPGTGAAMVIGGTFAKGAAEAGAAAGAAALIKAAFSTGGKGAAAEIAKTLALAGPTAGGLIATHMGTKLTGLAGTIGGQIGLAMGAAAAVYAAAEQARSLNKELGEDGSGWSAMWKQLRSDLGMTTQKDDERALGIWEGKDYDWKATEDAKRWSDEKKDRAAPDYAAAASMGYGMSSASDVPDTGWGGAPLDFAGNRPAKRGGGAGAAASADNAKLLNDMLRGAPLAVKISNPEDVRGGGAGGTGGPVPGYVDRQ